MSDWPEERHPKKDVMEEAKREVEEYIEKQRKTIFKKEVPYHHMRECLCKTCDTKQEELGEYCCKALWHYPVNSLGARLKEGMTEKESGEWKSCITEYPAFQETILDEKVDFYEKNETK